MDFLKTILILLLIYYAIKSILRYFGPTLLRYITKKISENFQRRFEGQANANSSSRNGAITVDRKGKSRTPNHKVGEYIDFEEIE